LTHIRGNVDIDQDTNIDGNLTVNGQSHRIHNNVTISDTGKLVYNLGNETIEQTLTVNGDNHVIHNNIELSDTDKLTHILGNTTIEQDLLVNGTFNKIRH